jgi:four helix bundle protein
LTSLKLDGNFSRVNAEEFKKRTMRFALDVIQLVGLLPPRSSSQVLGHQLLRASTSVGANYRAACRAKSTADFIHKMSTVEEEADESAYWLELIEKAGLIDAPRLKALRTEADQITAMVVASIKTVRGNKGR